MHRTGYGHTALGLDVDAYECLNKLRCNLFKNWSTLNVGIAVGYAVLQGFYLGINAHLSSRQTRNTHLHLNELYAAGFL